MDFPAPRWPPLNVITPFHIDSSGLTMRGENLQMNGIGTGTRAANSALFWPFMIFETSVAKKMSFISGNAGTGNADLGIYDGGKNLLVSSGSTALVGANTLQEIDIANTTLHPGQYFMALVFSSGSSTFLQFLNNDEFAFAAYPYYEAANHFPLPNPATFTLSSTTAAQVPAMGVHFDTLI